MRKLLLIMGISFFMLPLYAHNSKIDSLFGVLKTISKDTARVNTLNILGRELMNARQLQEGFKYSNEAKVLAEKLNYKIGVAQSVYNFGVYYFDQSLFQEAFGFYQSSYKLRKEINDKKGIATSLNSMGLVQAVMGNFSESLNLLRESLSIGKELNDPTLIKNATINIGFVHNDLGNYPEALKNYYSGLRMSEQIKDLKTEAMCYNNIGYIHDLQKEYDEALRNYSAALKIFIQIGDQSGVAMSYNNMGPIYKEKGDFTKALELIRYSLMIRDKIKEAAGVADCYLSLGEILYAMRNFQDAIDNDHAALKIYRTLEIKPTMALAFFNIGEAEMAVKNYERAANYLDSALSLSRQTGKKEIIKKSYHSLSKLDSLISKLPGISPEKRVTHAMQALHNYKMYILYKDTMSNEENTRKTVQTSMNYQFEKKEAATKADHEKKELLSNAEINRQKLIRNSTFGGVGIVGVFTFLLVRSLNRKKKSTFEKQVAEVETRALRSQMNPHFIFNSLNSIDDYILNNDIKNSSLYVNKFSRLMRLILESSRNEEVSLKEDLESLELYMQLENLRMQKKVECIIDVSPGIDTENVLLPPMLLQPFIENSFKHAFDGMENPKLEIKISLKDEMLHCTVTDNGKGRGTIQNVVMESKEKRKSLGMTVTKERLDIISKLKKTKAYMAFEDLMDSRQMPAGTRVTLSVPASFAF